MNTVKKKFHLHQSAIFKIFVVQFIFVSVLSGLFVFWNYSRIKTEYFEQVLMGEAHFLKEVNSSFSKNIKVQMGEQLAIIQFLKTLDVDSLNSRLLKLHLLYPNEEIAFFDDLGENVTEDSSFWVTSSDFQGRVSRIPLHSEKIKGYVSFKKSIFRFLPFIEYQSKHKNERALFLSDTSGNIIYAPKNVEGNFESAAAQVAGISDSIGHVNTTHLGAYSRVNFIRGEDYILFMAVHDRMPGVLNSELKLMAFFVYLFWILSFFFFCLLLFKWFYSPLQKINRKMRFIMFNNWNGKFTTSVKSREIQRLVQVLNDQLETIREQRDKQESYCKFLEAQIDKRDRDLEEKNKILQQLSTTDDLTGLPNRRDIFEKIKTEMGRAGRFNKKFALIMLDIDFFRSVNDTYGHLAGDFVLKELARISKRYLREYDYFSRYGGEEFLIMLPETDAAAALAVAERFRKNVESYEFKYEGKKIHLTASFGIVVFDSTLGIEENVNLAEKALYQSKKQGHNRVTLLDASTNF